MNALLENDKISTMFLVKFLTGFWSGSFHESVEIHYRYLKTSPDTRKLSSMNRERFLPEIRRDFCQIIVEILSWSLGTFRWKIWRDDPWNPEISSQIVWRDHFQQSGKVSSRVLERVFLMELSSISSIQVFCKLSSEGSEESTQKIQDNFG